MKFLINTKTITLGLMGSGMLLFSSCLKDSGPVEDFSTSPPVISFQTDGQGATSTSVAVLGTSSQGTPAIDSVELSLGVASLYLKTAVQVSVSAQQASLDAYNAANGTNYVLLPSSDYTIQNSGTITIPSGKNLVNFGVSFFGSSIDFTQSYALPLTITAASGGGSVVASNLNVYVLIITPANIYSGSYSASGTRTLYAGPTTGSGVSATASIGGTVTLSYVNDSTSEVQLADLTADFMDLTVHSDNTVTVGPAASGATFASLANAGTCTYDPATGTFTLNYEYFNGSGNLRQISETLVFQ
jgi:hypothetical protein